MGQKSKVSKSSASVIDRKFWKNFAANVWEKKPLFVKNFPASLLEMGEGEVFDLLVLYANKCRKLNDPTGFKFYIDGFKVSEEEVLQVLPEKTDKSLLGYHDRMKAMFSDYCLVCDELLTVNNKKQHLLTDFTDKLYRHVGFPNRFSEMGLYLGNYKKTPFGVHVDSCGVFSFPVVGKKRFRLWTSAYAKKNPSLDRAFKYEKHKSASQLLEPKPGDMTYWPSSAWHIAESDGSFSATWSLGVWVDRPHKQVFSESLKELLDSKGTASSLDVMTSYKTLHSDSGEVSELPTAYLDSIKQLQKLTFEELQENSLKTWMKHISLQGFKTVPHVALKVGSKSRIRLSHHNSPVLWQKSLTTKGKFYFSFGGSLIECAPSSHFLTLIKALNSQETCQVSSFLKGPQQKADLQILQKLADTGALSI